MPFNIFHSFAHSLPSLEFMVCDSPSKAIHSFITLFTTMNTLFGSLDSFYNDSFVSATIKYSELTNVNCIRSSIRLFLLRWSKMTFYLQYFWFFEFRVYFSFFFSVFPTSFLFGIACYFWLFVWHSIRFDYAEFSWLFLSYMKTLISRGLTLYWME